MKQHIIATPLRHSFNCVQHRYLSRLLTFVLLTCPGILADVHADNTLTVDPLVGRVGRTVYVPINLTNDDSAVAAQFDITLPFAMSAEEAILLSNRADNHSVSARQNGKTVTVILSSMTNKAIKGNSGLMLRIPMATYDDGKTDKPYAITLDNIVITDKDGHDIATSSSSSSTFTVSTGHLPDLTVSNISTGRNTLTPGGEELFSYTVNNTGDAATQAGWTAMIYIESITTGERTYITSQSSTQLLSAGGKIDMQATARLPRAMRLEGSCRVFIDVVPAANCGELIVDQANNSGYSAEVTVSKSLFLTANRTLITEGGQYPATVTLTRTGDCSVEEAFTLSSSVANLFTAGKYYYYYNLLPTTVVIPAGSSSTSFNLWSVNDDIVRSREADILVEAAHGYSKASLHMLREDNDLNPLWLTLSAASVTEGNTITLKVTRGGELTDELTLPLTVTHPDRFEQLPTLTFAPGQSTATATLSPTDDYTPHLDELLEVRASAKDYQYSTARFTLLDNDRPTLSLELTPSAVRENAGSSATLATLRRSGGTTDAITVRLKPSNKEAFSGITLIEIPAGASSVEVPIGVADNTSVDGTRLITFAAAMYFKAQSAYAPQGDRAYTTAGLTITDDESPYLSLSAKVTNVAEGSSAIVTVTRTTPSYDGSLTVDLTCNDASVTMPKSVTIPSGDSSAKFTLSINRNETAEDDRIFTVRSNAQGLEQGTLSLQITDRTLPDAVVTDVVTTSDLYSGVEASFSATVHNYGTAVLKRGTTIDFCLSSNSVLNRYAQTTPIFQSTLTQDIEIGEEHTFSFTGIMPEVTGTYWLYAHVNKNGAIQEFNTQNNVSAVFKRVYVKAPFSVVTIATDKQDYVPGEYVHVTGRMEGRLNGQTVRVRLTPILPDNYSQNSYADCHIDEQGNFTAAVLVDRSAYGIMKVEATALGQTDPAKSINVNIYNMRLSSSETRLTCDQTYKKQGTLRIYNQSGKAITGLALTTTSLPYGCGLTFAQLPEVIAAGKYSDIAFTVDPTVAMLSDTYQTFTVEVKCSEGVAAQLQFGYLCRAISSYLAFQPTPLNTTLLLNSSRTVEVVLSNYGLKATGPIALNLPSDIQWLSSLAPTTLPSLEPGQSATLRLQLTHQKGMHSGQTYAAQIIACPENGPSRTLNIKTTVVGTEYSTFAVNLEDVYSLASADYSHVSGAFVTIQDTKDGKTLFSGMTDGKGHWETSRITQGTYKVTLSALRHKSVVRTVTLGPGEEQALSCILPYEAVQAEFITSQSLEDNTYRMQMTIDVDTLAPQAIVIPTLTENGFCQSPDTLQIELRNVGSREAVNPRLVFPSDIEGVSFRVLNGYPSSLNPGERYVLNVGFSCPNNMRRRIIASLLLNYGFSISGHSLSESDIYQQLVGYVAESEDEPEPRPDVNPDVPEPDDDENGWFDYDEMTHNDASGQEGNAGAALPSINGRFSLTFDDVKEIRGGQSVSAVLAVFNGSDHAMSGIQFLPSVLDYDTDDIVTDLMPCAEFADQMTGFTKDPSVGYNLASECEGILPIRYTADSQLTADGSRTIRIGGQLSYVWCGIKNTAVLPNMVLTVSPVGKVRITYLVQQDYLGDDPLTENVSESVAPAEVVVLVSNIGSSDLSGVKIKNEGLEVLTNADVAPASLNGLYASVNGQAGNYDFLSICMDSLRRGEAKTARFMYSSPTMAHVSEPYDVGLTSRATADSEVLTEREGTYMLFRSVCRQHNQIMSDELSPADVDYTVAALTQGDCYLVSTMAESHRQPNAIITAETSIPEDLQLVSDAIALTGAAGTYKLTVNADSAGWVYGKIHDPTNGRMMLTKVIRNSDGAVVSAANFWQTDRTVQDDYRTINDNVLHFVDCLASAKESYTLTFTAREEERMKVLAIHLLTANNKEVAADATTMDPVTKIRIEFTKECKNVYKQYVPLTAHGEALDLGDNFITRISYAEYEVSLANAPLVPGLHTFTVITSSLKQRKPSLAGEGTDTISWTELSGAKARVDLSVGPNGNEGVIELSTGEYDYGPLTLQATPNAGYTFSHWTVNGQRQPSSEPSITVQVTGNMDVRAFFMAQPFNLTILQPIGGTISGASSGTFDYGKTLRLSAIPASDFAFDHWIVDGKDAGTDNVLSITIDKSSSVTAVFKQVIFTQEMCLSKGWNWISSYLSESIPVSRWTAKTERIVGQFDEMIMDPVYGFVGGLDSLEYGRGYKVKASEAIVMHQKGHINNSSLKLEKGWNWISYPYYEERNINEVISNPSEGEYLASQFGFSEFADGCWEGTLTNLTPGLGYIYKSCTDKTLLFDFSEKTSRTMPKRATATRNDIVQQNVDVHKYPSTMNMIVRLSDGYSMLDNADYRIYAFVGNECRGESQHVGKSHYLTVYGDEATTITFVVEDVNSGNTYMAKESLTFCQEVIGNRQSPYIITITDPTSVQDIEKSSHRMTIYSVEGILISSDATVDTLKQLSRGIYIVDGQKFLVK